MKFGKFVNNHDNMVLKKVEILNYLSPKTKKSDH